MVDPAYPCALDFVCPGLLLLNGELVFALSNPLWIRPWNVLSAALCFLARSCQQAVVRIYCAACDGTVPLSSSSMETERSTLSSQVLGFLSPHSMKGIVNFVLALQ